MFTGTSKDSATGFSGSLPETTPIPKGSEPWTTQGIPKKVPIPPVFNGNGAATPARKTTVWSVCISGAALSARARRPGYRQPAIYRMDRTLAWFSLTVGNIWVRSCRSLEAVRARRTPQIYGFRTHAYGIVNHADYPIGTSPLEGMNNKIKVIKRKTGLRSPIKQPTFLQLNQ